MMDFLDRYLAVQTKMINAGLFILNDARSFKEEEDGLVEKIEGSLALISVRDRDSQPPPVSYTHLTLPTILLV